MDGWMHVNITGESAYEQGIDSTALDLGGELLTISLVQGKGREGKEGGSGSVLRMQSTSREQKAPTQLKVETLVFWAWEKLKWIDSNEQGNETSE
ncbi:hypothetical protein BPAE_0003g00920 [Botrytis paeoniae]|uniref:Uncharacterized protein n=1 Tax=Botrytis paeoniae TaxID=278948 RepID=A0A4Z1G9V7_9HELO|nr:hypothetical protein BPAE_0003g00920 [Botrytis paeoniae]